MLAFRLQADDTPYCGFFSSYDFCLLLESPDLHSFHWLNECSATRRRISFLGRCRWEAEASESKHFSKFYCEKFQRYRTFERVLELSCIFDRSCSVDYCAAMVYLNSASW